MISTLGMAAVMAAALWAGVVIGISFIAQPAKFKISELALPVALEVGRRIFNVMHVVECAFALVALLSVTFAGQAGGRLASFDSRWLIYAAAIILFIQIRFLMPPLSKRVDAVLSGKTLPPASLHFYFAFLEVLKTGLLIAFSLSQLI